jgi:transposase
MEAKAENPDLERLTKRFLARCLGMAKPLVPDDLWVTIGPLLPPAKPRPKGGRPPVPDRAALTGIIFVLKTGIQWEDLPAEMGCGSGMTCWRRLRDWQAAGVWAGLHHLLLERLHGADRLDWSRASLDSASVPAKRGERQPVRTRRTAGKLAPSGTSSSMVMAPRSA